MNALNQSPRLAASRGFTLIETVVALVIIAMASATIIGLISSISARGAQTMSQVEANKIADAYLREVMAKPWSVAGGGPGRATLNDVLDYQTYPINDVGARDAQGTVIAALANYSVTVVVANAALGPVPAASARRITVTVTDLQGRRTVLVGFKTAHP
jgi:MSHA pilin protein MshD